jgi:hypothetical protein
MSRRNRDLIAVARSGQLLEHGRIQVAPPDHHLLVMGDALAKIATRCWAYGAV